MAKLETTTTYEKASIVKCKNMLKEMGHPTANNTFVVDMAVREYHAKLQRKQNTKGKNTNL